MRHIYPDPDRQLDPDELVNLRHIAVAYDPIFEIDGVPIDPKRGICGFGMVGCGGTGYLTFTIPCPISFRLNGIPIEVESSGCEDDGTVDIKVVCPMCLGLTFSEKLHERQVDG